VLLKNLRHALRLAWSNLRVAARHDVLLEKGVTLKYVETLSFGVHVTLQSSVYLYGSRRGAAVVLGDHVVVAAGAMVLGEGGVVLGDYTHVGPGVVITSQYGDATSPMVTSTPAIKVAPVRVGRGTWIGSRSVIMPGVTLGDRCVVAPGSVVFGRFGDDVTLSGNPARPVRAVRPRAAAPTP
jgi:acetyltransferase-like isoleucine patch superfamily enzyme